jgi:hypothetical protein
VPVRKDVKIKQKTTEKVEKKKLNQEIKIEISNKQKLSDNQLSNADLSDVIETVGNNDSIDTQSKGIVTIKKSKPGSQNNKSRLEVANLKAPQKLLKCETTREIPKQIEELKRSTILNKVGIEEVFEVLILGSQNTAVENKKSVCE